MGEKHNSVGRIRTITGRIRRAHMESRRGRRGAGWKDMSETKEKSKGV